MFFFFHQQLLVSFILCSKLECKDFQIKQRSSAVCCKLFLNRYTAQNERDSENCILEFEKY